MAPKISNLQFLFLFLILTTCTLLPSFTASQDDRKSYIVYMGRRHEGELPASAAHLSMLQKVIGSHFSPELLLHSYHRSFNGFVVKLSEDEVKKIKGIPEVISVFLNKKSRIQTTRSWNFMGFPQTVERQIRLESDIIIGVLDTGIWPQSPSFNDQGFGPPPTKWNGSCHFSSNFSCNNKIIGAKFYRSDDKTLGATDERSPLDSEGHGTHTASTAAGGLVSKANLFGLAAGTARGGVPSARIAAYKVCWSDGCHDADILAAFDDAIADGVDIISISVNGKTARDYFEDPIAIGAFHAMRNGILTSASAGNAGPELATTTNFAPWSLDVAASTIDRKFLTKVQLGNQNAYEGISINTFDLENVMYPLIYGGDAPNTAANFSSNSSRLCLLNSLNPELVKGKVVFCDIPANGTGPILAGAVGMVMQGSGPKDKADSFPLPASYLGTEEGRRILSYIQSTSDATAAIYKSDEVIDTFAPTVASFSSRGPNPFTPEILKPDIAAPGVHILAAWTPLNSVSQIPGDGRRVPYNIQSGTSMACPHVTGIAAYIKSYHPTWSPAAIKSAIMTTAHPMSAEDREFAYGAGHVNPLKAINPGLIYDAGEIDYVKFLCGQGYNTTLLRDVTGDDSICSTANSETVWDLNYPSFAIATEPSKFISRVFRRVVTNVGTSNSTYKVVVSSAQEFGLSVEVSPSVLEFTSVGQKLTFAVKIEGTIAKPSILSASLVWDDGVHQVRSPISVDVFSP